MLMAAGRKINPQNVSLNNPNFFAPRMSF